VLYVKQNKTAPVNVMSQIKSTSQTVKLAKCLARLGKYAVALATNNVLESVQGQISAFCAEVMLSRPGPYLEFSIDNCASRVENRDSV